MSPIERAARALAEAQSGVDDFDALDEGFQETLRENVRAVLQAIREPSEGMLDAAAFGPTSMSRGGEDAFVYISEDNARTAWQAMIDAALSDAP